MKKWYTGSRQASPAKPNTTYVESQLEHQVWHSRWNNGVFKDGPTIVDRGALPGVLKRPVATFCAVAASRIRSNYNSVITDHPWGTQKNSPGTAWFIALRPSSPVQLVTRALRNVWLSLSAFGTPGTLCTRSTSEDVRHGLHDDQPIAQLAQKSESVSAWTPAPLDRAAR